MATFPKTELDVMSLADQMCVGLANHPADFPSISAPALAQLQDVLDNYRNFRVQQETARSQAQLATVTKDESYDELVTLMKNALKKAETDTVAAPEKLSEIGWGPRNQPTPIVAPGTPTNLCSTAEGTGEIWLSWDKPPTDSGGIVRNYLVERCEKLSDNNFGPWLLVETTYNNEAHVVEQPSNARLIYRVKASNAGGESMPSNTILVVLP
jgi:hypothetical protein